MAIKARSRATNKKTAKRAPKPGTTAVDRRLLAQAKREASEGQAPAAALRDAKARASQAARLPFATNAQAKVAYTTLAAAMDDIGGIAVPTRLGDLCRMIGTDVKPDNFAVTALDRLAFQLGALEQIAEHDELGPYEVYSLIENVVERMRLASRVAAWLGSEQPLAQLPEVRS